MSVPSVASNASQRIQDHSVTDREEKHNANQDASRLDRSIESDQGNQQLGHGVSNEEDDLEKGTFQPHLNPHIEWDKQTAGSPKPPDATPNGIGSAEHMARPYGRGGEGRRPTVIGPDISSEEREIARTEAASWAQMTPLMAATLGPLSVLLAIPTLTQRWRGVLLDPPVLGNGISNFVELPDPTINIVLASVSLLCEVAGNGLLILRFSNFHTRITTWVSYAFWIAKIILGLANYIEFGIKYPATDNIIYLEGFWVCLCC